MSTWNGTIAEILDRYRKDRLPYLKQRTQRDYSRHLNYLRQQLGDKVANQLTIGDLTDFMNVRTGKIHRNRQMSILSATFTEAIRWGWLHANVCKEVQRHQSKRTEREVTEEEYEQVKQIARPRTRAVMDLVRLTGISQGEIVSLRWAQVQPDRILFRNVMTNRKITVEITPKIAAVLNDCGWKRADSGEYVIVTRSGVPYTREGFRACWQRVMSKWKESGNDIFTFHDIKRMWLKENPRSINGHGASNPAAPSDGEILIKPRVFRVPKSPASRTAAAVMMPLDPKLYRVYETIREACADTGFECRRADDIWEESTIIQDIFNLIYRSHVVIVDFTMKRPNVMYEAGLAHALGRHVVPIATDLEDVPFDIRHHRVLKYTDHTDADLAQLRQQLAARLRFIGE